MRALLGSVNRVLPQPEPCRARHEGRGRRARRPHLPPPPARRARPVLSPSRFARLLFFPSSICKVSQNSHFSKWRDECAAAAVGCGHQRVRRFSGGRGRDALTAGEQGASRASLPGRPLQGPLPPRPGPGPAPPASSCLVLSHTDAPRHLLLRHNPRFRARSVSCFILRPSTLQFGCEDTPGC